jgi:hypothetical protein
VCRTGGPTARMDQRIAFQSMVWQGESVVDLIGLGGGGGSRVCIDGTIGSAGQSWSYRFDGCQTLD